MNVEIVESYLRSTIDDRQVMRVNLIILILLAGRQAEFGSTSARLTTLGRQCTDKETWQPWTTFVGRPT